MGDGFHHEARVLGGADNGPIAESEDKEVLISQEQDVMVVLIINKFSEEGNRKCVSLVIANGREVWLERLVDIEPPAGGGSGFYSYCGELFATFESKA